MINKQIPVFFGIPIVRIILGYVIDYDTRDILDIKYDISLLKWYYWMLKLDIRIDRGFRSLWYRAFENDYPDILHWLTFEVKIHEFTSIQNPICNAIRNGCVNSIKWMLDNAQKIGWTDWTTETGMIYLDIACRHDELEIAKLIKSSFVIKSSDMRIRMTLTFRDVCLTGLLDVAKWFAKVGEIAEFPSSFGDFAEFIGVVKKIGHHDTAWWLLNTF